MTDKEFDSIIKDALLSEEVPPQLNRALLDKVKKKKQNKIFAFTKPATYAAAVFICAVAVLGYFNSDMPLGTETTPETAEVVSEDRDVSSDSQFNVKKEASPAEIPPEATESASGTPEVNSNAYNTQKTDVYSRKNSSNERAYVPEAKTAEKKAPQSGQETTHETTSAVSEEKQVVSENTDAVVETEATAETAQQAPAVEPNVAPVSVPVLSEKEQKAAAKAAAKADKEAAKAAAKADKEAEKYNKAAAKAARVMPTANSAAAIAAFVISLVAIFNFLNPLAAVLSLFAIIFSIAGIVNTGRGKASGRGLAVAALILALVTLIIMASIVAVVIWVYDANNSKFYI